MTNEEFSTWSRRLFIAFPSLWDWLQANSPSPLETQAIWRKCLEPYTLDECSQVLDEWSAGTREPFAAYERDKVHLRVRARIEQDRDRQRKRDDAARLVDMGTRRERSHDGVSVGVGSMMDRVMAQAVREGAVEHKRLLRGEITQFEFERLRAEILAKHNIGVPPNAKPV